MLYIIGCGPGNEKYLTREAMEIIGASDIVIGFDRLINTLNFKQPVLNIGRSLSLLIEEIIKNKDKKISLLASGDPNIYGIAKYISENVDVKTSVIPGISSVQYIFSRIKENMNDTYITSGHGKELNYDLITQVPKAVILTDSLNTPFTIARELIKMNLDPLMYIGEELSYENEKITSCRAEDVENRSYSMNVVVIINER